jgi:protein-arginine kinase activator protein McsA
MFYLNFDSLFGDFERNFSLNSYPKDDDPNYNKKVEKTETENHIVVTETWTSLDGNVTYTRTTMDSKEEISISKKVLQSELDLAVEEERYEDAVNIRDQLKKLS